MKEQSQNKGLFEIIKPITFEMILTVLLAAIGAITLILSLTLLSFTLSSIMIDTPIILFGIKMEFLNTILLLSVMIVIAFSSRLAAFNIAHLGAFRLEQILRTELSLHLAQVPLGYIISAGSGALKKVMQNDVLLLHAFVADSVPMIAKSVVAPFITLIILFWVDYRLALASIIILSIGVLIMTYTMKDSAHFRERYEKSQSEINKAVIEFTQAMPVVRTFDDGSSSFKRYNNSLYSYRDGFNEWMAQSSFSAKLGIIILSPLPTLIAVFVSAIYLLNNGSIELSSFILALFLSTGMADAMMPVMWLNEFIKRSQASAIRIFEVLDIEKLPQVKESQKPKNPKIVFENVSFSYEKTDKNALENVSFEVPQGSITALVGPSGAGKSTVAKLIPRFWDVCSGSIKIGEVNIKDINQEVLMDYVSFVFQDTFLFADTILNNIKSANPNANDKQVDRCSKSGSNT